MQELGYRMTVHTSSIEALKVFRNQPGNFDLIITDLSMPNMTGYELVTVPQFNELCIREYVMKPLIVRELDNAIRRALSDKK